MMKISLVLVMIVAGCGKKEEKAGAPPPSPKAEQPAKPTKPPLTAAWFGKTVAPPGELAKLKPGMPLAEAKKVSPIADHAGLDYGEVEDVEVGVQDEVQGGIDVIIDMPVAKKSLIEEAWGKGQDADRAGKPITVWFNPDAGIRAAFSDEHDGRAYLRFEPYQPLAKLLGPGPNIAALPKPFEGKTADELKAIYPEYQPYGMPATEWEFGSTINLSPYPADGKIESLAFSIPFQTPEQQAEILRQIEAKWGKPKGEVEFGSVGGEKTFVYNKKDPHIEVTMPGGYEKNSFTIRIGGK